MSPAASALATTTTTTTSASPPSAASATPPPHLPPPPPPTAANFTAMTRGFALLSLALALVAAGLVPLLHHFDSIPTELQPHLSGALALIPAAANGTAATEAPAVRIGGGAFAAAVVLYVVSLFVRRYVPTFSRAEKLKLKETRAFVASELLDEQQRLFKQYLDECRSDKQ